MLIKNLRCAHWRQAVFRELVFREKFTAERRSVLSAVIEISVKDALTP